MPYSWEYSPGEGWLNVFPRNQYWMQVRPSYVRESPIPEASPTAELPGSVGSPEVCFREPDGWISCVLRGTIWEQQKRARGLPEVPQDAAEFIPVPTADVTRIPESVVVSSHPSEDLPENEAVLHGEGGWVDTAIGLYDSYSAWQQTPIYNFGGPGAAGPAPPAPAVTPGGCPSCSSSPCVCGTINGRPALVDPRTGKRCYRRRRRVMLTEGDFNTLLRIATLPNNANVRTALAKAIGRR